MCATPTAICGRGMASLVAEALNKAGYLDLPRAFFQFCDRVHSREGYLLHKYNPDGSLASSWLPWAVDGEKHLPIQEDETALVHVGIVGTFLTPWGCIFYQATVPVDDMPAGGFHGWLPG